MPIRFYRGLSIVSFIIATLILPFESSFSYSVSIIIFLIGVFLAFQYKCPKCGRVLDIRRSTNYYKKCPKCGHDINCTLD